jgi:hypothetical protein
MLVSAALRAAETSLLRMLQDLSYPKNPFEKLILRALRARKINFSNGF